MEINTVTPVLLLFALVPATAAAASKDLGHGFADHGVATPLSNHRGMVATADGQGRDVMLVWLYDHRGAYALLMIDAETGGSEQFATPYPWGGDGPFASLLSRQHKYYTHFGSHFSEFDPVKRAFTFVGRTAPRMAMSMTEADDGTIWSASYPNCGLVSFNPATRAFRDHGSLNKENWLQYPRSVAVDDAGWVYIGIGSTAGQIVIYDPEAGARRPLFAAAERTKGHATVNRYLDGKVYGHLPGAEQPWYEFHAGTPRKLDAPVRERPKKFIASSQALFHQQFPSGRRAVVCDTIERVLEVEDPAAKQRKTVRFEYTSEGAHLMGLAASPDGTVCGGTAFPMRFFSYNPREDRWINRPAFGQFNTVARQGDRMFFGGYTHGFLLEWNPAQGWLDTARGNPASNPLFLTECAPIINRPHHLLAHPDGRHVVLAGTPDYGYTGGGLLIWDRHEGSRRLLRDTDVVPEQSTLSMVALPAGQLLGGTTTSPGTGGEKKAAEAELYVLDVPTGKVDWHAAVFPGAQSYTALCSVSTGLVAGFVDRGRFFIFDPQKRTVVHEENTTARLGPCVSQQGPRVFVQGAGDALYILFTRGIASIDRRTFEIKLLASSPVPISAGGDYLDGRIYFGSGSHVYSWRVAESK